MAPLDNKVALVTGGAHGFGRVLALTLARAGADIAIADMGRSRQSSQFAAVPDLDQINGVVKEVEALGRHAIGLLTDVRKGDDCQHMAQKTIEAFGHVDILCANAGTFLDDMRPAWELPEADWDVIFDVNLKGAWLTTKYVVPHNETTAADVLALLARIQAGTCVSPEASARMRETLAAQQLQAKLGRRLPLEIHLANKTGEVGEVSHDAGIVTGPGGTLLVAVLTRAVEPAGHAADLIGDVALALARATGLAGPT